MTQNDNYQTLEQAFSLGNGQESALNWLYKNKQEVAVFLISGIKLEGTVTGHDQYSLLLTDSHVNQQLIYKAKISTIALAQSTQNSRGPQNKQPRRYNQPKNNEHNNN